MQKQEGKFQLLQMTKKYIYHVLRLNIEAYEHEDFEDLEKTQLDMRGDDGWELVSVTTQNAMGSTWKYYYFKKEK